MHFQKRTNEDVVDSMYNAIKNGEQTTVNKLMESVSNLDEVDDSGFTVLMLAASKGYDNSE